MATAYNIALSAAENKGIVHVASISKESAEKVSELLNRNHEKHHALFNNYGLHNHIVHHLLCNYALGATPNQLQEAYDMNEVYQRPPKENSTSSLREPPEPFNFDEHVGDQNSYLEYLLHFQKEIDAKGVPAVLNEYLFSGDARAEDMFGRMNSGLFHPMIHLGYGIEFNQPAIVAEALAQAIIHKNEAGNLCFAIEKLAQTSPDSRVPEKTIMSMMDEIRADEKVSRVTTWNSSPAKWLELCKISPNELSAHLVQYSVPASQLQRKTAEMIQACAWMASTAQHPGKVFMADFFSLHLINLSLWYSVFLQQDWISEKDKCRLLEWKVWQDLEVFAAGRAPQAYPDRIEAYTLEQNSSWDSVLARTVRYRDDGHTSKFIRALKHVEAVSEPYYGTAEFPLRPNHLLKVAHMTMDSVETMDAPEYSIPEHLKQRGNDEFGGIKLHPAVARVTLRFVRWAGFEEAWEDVPAIGSKM